MWDEVDTLWDKLHKQYPYAFSYNIFDEEILPKVAVLEKWLADNCSGRYNCFPPYRDENDIVIQHIMAIFIEQEHDAEMFRLTFGLPINDYGVHLTKDQLNAHKN